MLFLFSVLFYALTFAQSNYTRDKNIRKAFAVGENTTLEVVNKYGNVIFQTWEKDSVEIAVKVRAETSKAENLTELIEMAAIEIERHGSFITANTNWGKNASLWNKSVAEVSRIIGSNQKITIDYSIRLPENMAVEIENKFGDVYFPPFEGAVRIDLAHGDLRCREFKNPKQIHVSYGKAILDNLGDGNLILDFASLRTLKAGRLKINAVRSEIFVEEAQRLDFDSKNDQINVNRVEIITGEFRFSTLDMQNLITSMDIKSTYGSVDLRHLSEKFTDLRLQLIRGSVSLSAPDDVSFNFTVTLKDGKEFASVPSLITVTRDENIDNGRMIEGYWVKPNAARQVRINGESAQIKVAAY